MIRATPALFALTLAALPGLAAAQTPMTAAEFEAYVTGKTLFFSSEGQAYGAEQYLPNRRVIWTFLGDECQEGFWYENQGQICFVYDFSPDPQCWTFWQKANGLGARFENDPAATELYEVYQSPEPLVCEGPDVGA